MKKLVIIIVFLVIYGCKKREEANSCFQLIKASKIEVLRGNVYYFHSFNYSEIIGYEIYKKYGLVDYLQLYPITVDSCFRKIMNERIETKIKLGLLNKEVRKLKYNEEISQYKTKGYEFKFSDGIYYPLGSIDYPFLRYPMNETDFKRNLINSIKEEVDKNYGSSSFWIVINKKGKIESIERYKRYSNIVDSYIEKRIKQTIWIPSLNKKDSTFVKSRILFDLSS
jgi:hypothetical protein